MPGRDAVVVLGNDYWKDQFASDQSIVGRTLRLNGIDFTVIGVAPESFKGMDQYVRPAMFVPVMMITGGGGGRRGSGRRWFRFWFRRFPRSCARHSGGDFRIRRAVAGFCVFGRTIGRFRLEC